VKTLGRNQSGIGLGSFVLVALIVGGCQNQNVGGGPASTTSTVTTTTPPPTSNGGVSCAGNTFCINVNEPVQTTQVLHLDGNYTQPCNISAGQDAACILESAEEDLYWQGTTLAFNVPAGMCPYFRFTPYFYYQYQPGVGPVGVSTNTDASGNVTLTNVTYPGGITGVITGGTQASPPAGSPPALSPVTLFGGSLQCGSDYSQNTPVGPNCCGGHFALISVVAGSPTTTATETWGGNPNNCLAGPAIDTQKLSANGYPESSQYTLDGVGLNSTYVIQAPGQRTSVQLSSNAYISNYWVSTATPTGTGNSYPLVASGGFTGAPLALVGPLLSSATPPVDPGCSPFGNNGDVFCTGNPWYQFECLDQAEDLIGRVRVMIRSWTSEAQFSGFVAANGVGLGASGLGSFIFNLSGAEPAPYIDQPFEDRETWVIPQTALGVAGSQGYNNGTATQSFGFGNLYPQGAN
jgi:hypothetical protein